MKYITVSIFRDKNDGTIYREGDELELTKKRFQEINSAGAGILVTELSEDDEKKQDETTTGEKSTEGNGESLGTGAGGA